MLRFKTGWLLLLIAVQSHAQKKSIQSADIFQPILMLGYVDFREASVWMMSKTISDQLQYWETDHPENKKLVEASVSKRLNAYMVSTFYLGPLEPGKSYTYRYFNPRSKPNSLALSHTLKTPELWRWRKAAPDFRIAFGSCHYTNEATYDRPGKPYGDTAMGIFDQIAARQPDLMLWLGDNIYLREPDWGSRTGIRERYIHARIQPAVRKLLTACPNLSIWDDHDFGPNDANASFYNKELTLEAFRDFWPNPGCGINGIPGNTYAFDYMDAHFFMLDNRYNRTPDFCDSCAEETILGKAQLEWLKMSLLSAPHSEFKIVCLGGQFLNSFKEFEIYSRYEWERSQIIDFIQQNNIPNVVFLTGDRHFSELSVLKKEGKPTLYDFTVSPLTSGVFKNVTEVNLYRVPGSLYQEDRSFGMIEFTGSARERTLHFLLYNKEGKEIYRYAFVRE